MTSDLQAVEGEVVPDSPAAQRFVIGVMTGTSLDGIDAVLIESIGHGANLKANIRAHVHTSLGPVAVDLARISAGEPVTAAAVAATTHALSHRLAESVAPLLDPAMTLACIAVHGQTVHHDPPTTLQLIDPAPIVAATSVPVVVHQRPGDLACGGQGAPITPLADLVLFADAAPCVVVNLGGFANATALGPPQNTFTARAAAIRAADLCPCNHLLDTFARTVLDAPYDDRGAMAASGIVQEATALKVLNALQARSGDGALGEADMHLDLLHQLHGLEPPHAAATLTRAVGTHIAAQACALGAGPLLLAGGGTAHAPLVATIADAAERPTRTLPEALSREAAAMAVLALLELDGVPPTLPGVTGRAAGTVPGSAWMRPLG